MPKSKQRKNHKKKLAQFKNKQQQQRNQFRKAYMETMNNKRMEHLDGELEKQRETEENIINTEEMGLDFDDDLKIDDIDIESMGTSGSDGVMSDTFRQV